MSTPTEEKASPAPEPCTAIAIDRCAPITEPALPATRMTYVSYVEARRPRWLQVGDTPIRLACNAIEGARLSAMARIEIGQDWYLQELVPGDLASVISLGPGEEVIVKVTRSQRTKLDSTTLDSKESVQSAEAQIADKEMLEVARTATKNEQWSVSLSGNVEAGPIRVAMSVGHQQSVQSQSEAKLQQVREATQLASNELRTLNKVEITRTTEAESTDEKIRKLTNPYRDRSLNLSVFELTKVFCVKTGIERIEPVLALHAPLLAADRGFVLRNGDFLATHLIDQRLVRELQAALEYLTNPEQLVDVSGRVDELTYKAIFHLFGEPGVHILSPGSLDHPDESFARSGPEETSRAWRDTARREHADHVFLLLGSFRRVVWESPSFRSPVSPDESSRSTRVDLVVGFAEQLKAHWGQITPADKREIFGTTIYRRVPAFLAIVEHLLKPLLGRAQEDDGAGQRAESVIQRVLKHLRCFHTYYTEQFHDYIYQLSHRSSHIEMVRDAVLDSFGLSTAEKERFFKEFDLERLFLSRATIFIPYRGDNPDDLLAEWFPDEKFGGDTEPTRDQIVVPADGSLIEPSVGKCSLPDLEADA